MWENNNVGLKTALYINIKLFMYLFIWMNVSQNTLQIEFRQT